MGLLSEPTDRIGRLHHMSDSFFPPGHYAAGAAKVTPVRSITVGEPTLAQT
jgi:hypothetical protein